MKRIFTGVILTGLSISTLAAGNLATDSQIEVISSSSNGSSDDFYIKLSGGTGPCVASYIVFPRNLAPSDDAFNRMYSLAMMAFATKSQKVRVFTAASGLDCVKATFIEIKQ